MSEPDATKCAVCGCSLLDKARINDLCVTCEFAISHKGDPTLLTEMRDEDDEKWRSSE